MLQLVKHTIKRSKFKMVNLIINVHEFLLTIHLLKATLFVNLKFI